MGKEFKPTLLQRAFPGIAAKRAENSRRLLTEKIVTENLRSFEAGKLGGRNSDWRPNRGDGNTSVKMSAAVIRNRARQMIRDNPHAENMQRVVVANTIGTGITGEVITSNKNTKKAITKLYKQHMESTDIDADGLCDLYGLQDMALSTIFESGSVLVRRRKRRSSDGLALPFQIQLLEPDFLDTTKDGTQPNGNYIIQGKEYNKRGKLVQFHIYTEHPGATVLGGRSYRSITVPAKDMVHVFMPRRPGQVDDVSWLKSVMVTLSDLADTRDAYQLRQKIAACFAVFLQDHDLAGTPGGGLSGPSNVNLEMFSHIEPARVQDVPAGKEVKFADPPGVEGMSDFDKAQLRTTSVGPGIPYEALTNDLSGVNFLSGRMGWLSFYRNIDRWRTRMILPLMLKRIEAWFLEAVELQTGIQTRDCSLKWIAPHRDLLDPVKELTALRDEARMGTLPFDELCRMRGRDPEETLELMSKWQVEFDKNELVLDIDGRKFSRAGNATSTKPATEKTEEDPEEGDEEADEE